MPSMFLKSISRQVRKLKKILIEFYVEKMNTLYVFVQSLRDNILFDHILDWGWCKLFYGNCFILSNKTLCIINWRKYLDYEYSRLIWMTVSRVYHPNSYFWSLIVWTVLCKQFYFTKQNIQYHQLDKSVNQEYYPCIWMLVSWEYYSSACFGTRMVPTNWVEKVKKSHPTVYCCNDISDTLIKFDIKAISGSDSVRMTVLLTDACAKCRNRRADHLIRIQQEPGLRRNNFIFHQIRWLASYSRSLFQAPSYG